ncbi:endonuclease domain-containing protein [Actinotalea sp. K2]|uniref:endonuclease domain-containing protein n=1 Tax=Actinotalea sp. K2 TaxID=2939438 RepID=UPI002017F14B|nr:DUF559 domain-containing protein [Actinotalea sp. K2]MCL3862860.1 DUF559 domain-containing protein [Actinotalea sp. K2]
MAAGAGCRPDLARRRRRTRQCSAVPPPAGEHGRPRSPDRAAPGPQPGRRGDPRDPPRPARGGASRPWSGDRPPADPVRLHRTPRRRRRRAAGHLVGDTRAPLTVRPRGCRAGTTGWWGNVQRRQALRDIGDGTLSAAERRLRVILQRSGITGWRFDQQVLDVDGIIGRADVLFVRERLVLEVDGFASHGRAQFQHDRTRQNRLVAAGFTVLRFTWADLTERPHAVADQVRSVLRRLRTSR